MPTPTKVLRDYRRWLDREAIRFGRVLHRRLQEVAQGMATQITDALVTAGEVNKLLERVLKVDKKKVASIVDRAGKDNWDLVFPDLKDEVEGVFVRQGRQALRGVGVKLTTDVLDQVDENAVAYAEERAAMLIGMRVNANGDLVRNPRAEYSISETSRLRLRELVGDGVEEGMSADELRAAILDSFDFSDSRAETIARTELAFAHTEGNMAGWRMSGVVVGKESLLGSEHDDTLTCDCAENADAGVIPLDAPFPDGNMNPPYHPNCVCAVAPVLDNEMDQGEKAGD